MKNRSLISLLLCACVSFADEGMWTFDNLPTAQLKEKYNWVPTQEWLDQLRLASVKFPGGSGAFVSSSGLVLTNQHIARGAISRVSAKGQDLVGDGFVASSLGQEIKLPNYELQVLTATHNVTDQVKAVATQNMTPRAADKARKAKLEQVRSEMAKAETSLDFDSVSLYQGGEYWIYAYKKFSDVRLVAVPELQVADFGGSLDNYTFPRWGLDFALLRVYENDKPYKPTNFLPWTKGGGQIGDLVIVSGHPGATFRQHTLAQMEFARDYTIPARMRFQERQKAAILEYGKTSPDAVRHARDAVWGIDNGYKRIYGQLSGLKNPTNIAKVANEEKELRAKVAANPALQAIAGNSWAQIENAIAIHKQLLDATQMLDGRGSVLLSTAINLVRWAQDSSLPTKKRPNISDNALKTRKDAIARQQKVEIGLDMVRLRAGLQEAVDTLGARHEIVKTLTGGEMPAQAAENLLTNTQFNSEDFRKQLLEGGNTAVKKSKDPLIIMARNIVAKSVPYRKQMEEKVTAVISEHAQRIAEARFAILGKTHYPDATNTLRITFGLIATYPANGTLMQPFTTFHGLLDRHEGWGGNEASVEGGVWTLPQRWLDKLPDVDMTIPYNFVYACDTVGGNSGSPVVNTVGEVVGLNFDSNIEGQAGYYVYDGNSKRSIAVDARAIVESLAKVMEGEWIVNEIFGGGDNSTR